MTISTTSVNTPVKQRIIHEALDLFNKVHFSDHDSNTLTGRNVSVTATTLWNDDDSLKLLVTCFVHAPQNVNWTGICLKVVPENQNTSPIYICRLNSRGDGRILSLPSGDYRLAALRTTNWGNSQKPVVNSTPKPNSSPSASDSLAQLLPKVVSMDSTPEEEEKPVSQPWECVASADDKVKAMIRRVVGNRYVVSFEADGTEYIDAKIEFDFIDSNNRLVLSGEISLKPEQNNTDKAVGRWSGEISTDQPCTLSFAVLSQD